MLRFVFACCVHLDQLSRCVSVSVYYTQYCNTQIIEFLVGTVCAAVCRVECVVVVVFFLSLFLHHSNQVKLKLVTSDVLGAFLPHIH